MGQETNATLAESISTPTTVKSWGPCSGPPPGEPSDASWHNIGLTGHWKFLWLEATKVFESRPTFPTPPGAHKWASTHCRGFAHGKTWTDAASSLPVTLSTLVSNFRNSGLDGHHGTRTSSAIKGSLRRPALISGSGKTDSCTLFAVTASLASTLGEELIHVEHDTHEPANHGTTKANGCHAMALRPVQLVRIDSFSAKGKRCILSSLRRDINGVLRKFR